MKRTRVRIKYVGKPDPGYIAPSGAPIGYLAHHSKVGKIQGNSPKYNSSFLVCFDSIRQGYPGGGPGTNQTAVFDIHDQYFEYLHCICTPLALHQTGCHCGGI
jgi:hypothetical protein